MHYVNILVLLFGSTLSTNIEIIQQPDSAVFQGSTQTISWRTNMTLNMRFWLICIKMVNLSLILDKLTKMSGLLRGKSAYTATCGSNYFLKINMITSSKSKYWINTQSFDIIDNFNWKDLLWLLGLLICFVPYCVKK